MTQRIYDTADLGRVLRERRRAAKLTQLQAALLTGVSQRLWSECEQGKRTQVGFETVLRMLHTLGLDLDSTAREDQQAGQRF